MKAKELKQKYLEFFKNKNHIIIPSASLIPDNDPTALFTTAGMHPLVSFIMGQPHPSGKRLVNAQKCLRTQDIDEVGDSTHTTFFEMLGNWSLGDYFKKEAIEMSFEFLTKTLNFPLSHLAFTCFEGDKNAPKDEEAAKIWLTLGVPKERIAFLGKEDNWWGPVGDSGPCGPDTEMFYWVGETNPPKEFDPNDNNWMEIWNDVFIQYDKTKEGKFTSLKNKTIDTGLGLERVTAVLQGKKTVFDTELFQPIFEKITQLTDTEPNRKNITSYRIIADHLRASVFLLGDERKITPSNVDQGYILRRFIRRTIRHLKNLGLKIENIDLAPFAKLIIKMYQEEYPLLKENSQFIIEELKKEQEKFKQTLEKGLKEFNKMSNKKVIPGKDAFLLFQSYGFPLELTVELANEKGINVDEENFHKEYQKHQELSRIGAEKKFKGGLSESSEETKKLHTTTHLLAEALRKIISPDIKQRGSNITDERLRFDFNFDRKLTDEEKKAIEEEVNKVIQQGLEVKREEMSLDQAKKLKAQAEFGLKYPDQVSVYFIGDYSIEICGGPHIKNTKELGKFKIKKEQSSAAGIRRIKAVLE
ncbi:alanine--tRNA ligase [Candidatus Woesearchaeota archaeon]|jgi:alanyl-tRNA synthetase|nr:alanine--tRNA ligase [Candidatus Woesearchaeota archaeon]